jgi:hypothetical protein
VRLLSQESDEIHVATEWNPGDALQHMGMQLFFDAHALQLSWQAVPLAQWRRPCLNQPEVEQAA